MPKRRKLFFDIKFNEWLFNVLVNLTPDQKQYLNHAEIRLLRSPSSIKAFIANENLERQLTLLSKIGLQWNLSFFENTKIVAETVKATYRQYTMKGKTVENIEDLIKQKVFVINSRDVSISLSLMSLNCHSDVYVLNPGFLSFRASLKDGKNANISSKYLMASQSLNKEYSAVLRGTKQLSKLCIETLRIDDYLAANFKIQLLDMTILWILYSLPYNYVSIDYIKRELVGKYKPASIGMRCSYLFRERRMIDKKPSDERVPSFIILPDGITAVGMVNNHLINRSYGE